MNWAYLLFFPNANRHFLKMSCNTGYIRTLFQRFLQIGTVNPVSYAVQVISGGMSLVDPFRPLVPARRLANPIFHSFVHIQLIFWQKKTVRTSDSVTRLRGLGHQSISCFRYVVGDAVCRSRCAIFRFSPRLPRSFAAASFLFNSPAT